MSFFSLFSSRKKEETSEQQFPQSEVRQDPIPAEPFVDIDKNDDSHDDTEQYHDNTERLRTRCYNYSCQGESHKGTDKECQDYSCTFADDEHGFYIAVVCDGHGGDTYFRSAFGAKAAADITVKTVQEFVRECDKSTFANLHLTQVGTLDTIDKQDQLDIVMRHLFATIYAQWRQTISEDASRPVTEWETNNVKPEHLQLLQDPERIVKVYGCTLMTYVQTPDYWFAFHLGDGKCVMLDVDMQFSQPIPWDEKCFLNKTTSLCGSNPVNDFRYCVESDNYFPAAIFLGSDGLDDTFGDGDRLYNFYGNIIRSIKKEGLEAVIPEIQSNLPKLSKSGSQDDMSVAFVYNEKLLDTMSKAIEDRLVDSLGVDIQMYIKEMAEWQQKLTEIEQKIEKSQKESKDLESRKLAIEREYQRCKANYEKSVQSLRYIKGDNVKIDDASGD